MTRYTPNDACTARNVTCSPGWPPSATLPPPPMHQDQTHRLATHTHRLRAPTGPQGLEQMN
eukprot:scaffold190514_cov39-Attheya_sp.AAC.1